MEVEVLEARQLHALESLEGPHDANWDGATVALHQISWLFGLVERQGTDLLI